MTRLGKILPFGLLFVAEGNFFFKKVTQENGNFWSYFFKRLELLHFHVLIAFTIHKIDELMKKLKDYRNNFEFFLEAQNLFSRHSSINFVT